MANEADVLAVQLQEPAVSSGAGRDVISLTELSAIRFSTTFDHDTQRIVLHDLSASSAGQGQRTGRRSIVVD